MHKENHKIFKTSKGGIIEQWDLYDERGNWWGFEETATMSSQEIEEIYNCKVMLRSLHPKNT